MKINRSLLYYPIEKIKHMSKYFFFVAIIVSCFYSCLPVEEESMMLSFWTETELSDSGFTKIFINDESVGSITKVLNDPICGDAGLLNVPLDDTKDMHIDIRNSSGQKIKLGLINLYSVSQGIKIKPAREGALFVALDLDDPCVLIRLAW